MKWHQPKHCTSTPPPPHLRLRRHTHSRQMPKPFTAYQGEMDSLKGRKEQYVQARPAELPFLFHPWTEVTEISFKLWVWRWVKISVGSNSPVLDVMWISDAFNYNRGRKFQLWADIEGAPLVPGAHFEAGKLQLDWRCGWMISILGFMVPFYSAGVMKSLNLLYDNGRVLNSCVWTSQHRNPVKADSTDSGIQ